MLRCLTGRARRRPLSCYAAGAVALALGFGGLAAGSAVAAVGHDLGDAPSSYDHGDGGRAAAVVAGPRLGTKVTADPAGATTSDSSDDAVTRFASWRAGRQATASTVVTVSHVEAASRLCGWIDFDLDHAFGPAERSCVDVPVDARQVRLSWTGRPAKAGQSEARLRIGVDAAQVERPTGLSDTGEVEDYPVTFVAATADAAPAITLDKTVSPTSVSKVGQLLTYRFVAKNTGNVALTSVTVTDELPGLSAVTCDAPDSAALAPDDSRRCTATRTVTQDDLDFGTIANIAKVAAEAPGGDPGDDTDDVTALDDATVTAVQKPATTIAAKWSASKTRKGKRLTLTLTAENTGNVTLTRVRISSGLKKLGHLTCTPKQPAELAPGATLRCSGRYTVSAADASRGKVKAVGTVRAERPYGNPSRSADDVVASTSKTVTVAKTRSRSGSGSSGAGHQRATLASTGGVSPWWSGAGVVLIGGGIGGVLLGRRRTGLRRGPA